MPRTRVLQRSDFIKSAMEFVDESGLDGLNLRSLGTRVGVSHTAIYNHFRDKDELLAALLEEALSGLVEELGAIDGLAPREAMTSIVLATRAGLARHPRLLPALASNTMTLATGADAMLAACRVLTRAGVAAAELPGIYMALESYVVGASIYDFAGAPSHVDVRRTRFRMLGIESFDSISRTADDVAAHTEATFRRGLAALIDGLLPS